VELVWKHGGVFDKMVGDCVIAHFGPPFYKETAARRAQAAVETAFAIQDFTRRVEKEPEFSSLAAAAGIPGLRVAIGVNLCPAAVGLFGPNRDFTAFSRGMNETARLQSQAGFRETLVMEPVAKALRGARGFTLDGPHEAAAKNVAKPLRYYKVSR
jgi:adenylate cyclase